MRTLFAAAAVSLAMIGAAAAEPVAIAPATFSPEFMEKLEDDYGVRETQALNSIVESALRSALTRSGASVDSASAVRIETTIEDARPNRPTFQQLADEPGLDYGRSFGVGGAKFHGVLRGADGSVLGEVTYRWYENDIHWAYGNAQWHDARRAARGYAERVAELVEARGV